MPSTAVIGVRISWLIAARNSPFARSAASARARARSPSRRAASAAFPASSSPASSASRCSSTTATSRVAEGGEAPADMVHAGASLQADQARRQIGQALLEPVARQLLTPQDPAVLVHTDQVEDVLAGIDADGRDQVMRGAVGHGCG